MLSKLSTLILGTIAESKKNPYELTKMIKQLDLNKWFSIAESTVYATINTLKKKGLITGERLQKGNFPEKTVYSITAEGEFELHRSISKYLERNNLGGEEFDVAILLMHNLGKEELMQKLKFKLESLESANYDLKKKILKLELKGDKHSTNLTLLKHRLYLLEAETKTIKDLIKNVNLRKSLVTESPFDLRVN